MNDNLLKPSAQALWAQIAESQDPEEAARKRAFALLHLERDATRANLHELARLIGAAAREAKNELLSLRQARRQA